MKDFKEVNNLEKLEEKKWRAFPVDTVTYNLDSTISYCDNCPAMYGILMKNRGHLCTNRLEKLKTRWLLTNLKIFGTKRLIF